MTPQQARIALAGFLVLAGGVAVNALYLQQRPVTASRAVIERPLPRTSADRMRNEMEAAKPIRPAPRAPAAGDERTQRLARVDVNSATVDAMPDTAAGIEERPETIRAIQRELRDAGYGKLLVVDGVMRPVLRAAIMAYEHDQGLPLTGEASEAILKRILLGGPAAEPIAGGRLVASVRAVQVVRLVQELLTVLRYQPGPVDGQLGEATLRAIREFEMDSKVASQGRISAELLLRLAEAAGPAGKAATR